MTRDALIFVCKRNLNAVSTYTENLTFFFSITNPNENEMLTFQCYKGMNSHNHSGSCYLCEPYNGIARDRNCIPHSTATKQTRISELQFK